MKLYAFIFLWLPLLAALNPTESQFGAFLKNHKMAHPGKPLNDRTIDELRAGTKVFLQYAGDPAEVSYVDQQIPARDGSPLLIRIFNDQLPPGSPVLIFYPGCAFVFDLFEVNSIICSRIALHSGIKVILVQFRLVPENSMPSPIYDGYDAACYIAAHPKYFGIDSHKIFLGGWCSGAHCAAAVSSLAKQNPQLKVFHQILIGGSYDLTGSTHDFDAYEKEDQILERSFLNLIAKRFYNITPADFQNPLLSPYHQSDLNGLPPTTIICGEYDALRNDSEAYFQKMKDGGTPVEKLILEGQTHNTIAMRKVLTGGVDPALVVANVIQQQLLKIR